MLLFFLILGYQILNENQINDIGTISFFIKSSDNLD
ncbi:hypothetical protein SAMN02746065_11566 [Desulfocicer vacuolatum DSM 3385]|uniref:Uncharacterized protein n=1 Tax=Desulfocicer vacuolatum DSM 3385 TaxID=1121400 RepID=A0A1W2D5K9_9BACT|nr:hypothetical protein SAMN02746065_11566 [Desulfocicer vacuolatum DSM 3385]